MADRTPSDSPLASDRLDTKFNPYSGGEHGSWTDGLPHDFKGWGPQTPDPSSDSTGEAQPDGLHLADDGLQWDGGESHKHIVWSFDRKHRHH